MRVTAEKLRVYRERDRERHNAKRREWAAANLEKRRESVRKYYQKNKHRIDPKRTKEQDVARKRVERARHPERFRAAEHRARAKRSLAAGSFSASDVSNLMMMQAGRCAMCRAKLGAKYHVDHIIPLARGGTNWSANLQLLCAPCNLSKGAKDPLVFARERGLLL